ncbi:class I SAM-dependent methyltransferase [Anaerosinus massiliensis]|uniref:class I SAM-dependent methyltransferase n=1 Tax=Massilibacillus massiliensis TaxID=1806837 RepID=UPI000A6286C1|nr:class I SAM-dependent methyltransferase [Massilibacillus massiliensis]
MDIACRIKKYWNERSEEFNRIRRKELESKDAAAWQSFICELLPAGNTLNILDVGTGTGFFAILMAQLGHTVTGIDAATEMIGQAKQNAETYGCDISFFCMDAQKMDFSAQTFDVILSRNLTWTLPNVEMAYNEWFRLLKSGGTLLNFDSDYGQISFYNEAQKTQNVHHGIDTKLLAECDALKNGLPISQRKRPQWDITVLQNIGFHSCKSYEAIENKVHKETTTMRYDTPPLFALYAKK